MGRLRGVVVLVAALAVGGAATLYTRHRPPAEPYFEDWTPRHEYPRSYVVPEGMEIDWPRVPVEGRVFDADGEPLGGRLVRVSCQPHRSQGLHLMLGMLDSGTWVSEDVTDERGHYEASTLLGATAWVTVLVGGPDSVAQVYDLCRDPVTSPDASWDVRLEPGVLELVVRDADGRSVSGVDVEARAAGGIGGEPLDHPRWAVRGETDLWGRCRLPVRLQACDYVVRARDGEEHGFLRTHVGWVETEVTLTTPRRTTVELVPSASVPAGETVTVTPGQGLFDRHSVVFGEPFDLRLFPRPSFALSSAVELGDGTRMTFLLQDDVRRQRVRLPETAEVPVRVVDAQGRGVAGAFVYAGFDAPDRSGRVAWAEPAPTHGRTNADGWTEALRLPVDPYLVQLRVFVDGRLSSTFPKRKLPADGTEPLVLEAGQGTGVRGRVIDRRGEPVAGAWIAMQFRCGASNWPGWESAQLPMFGEWAAVTDDDGRFDFAHHPVDETDPALDREIWIAVATGGRARTYEPVDLGPERVEVELRLEE